MADMYAKHLMCRGKTEFGWVEGYFLPYHPDMPEGGPVIVSFADGVSASFQVEPETVTACSGLPSKTGRLIYDQDIVIDQTKRLAGLVEYSEEDGTFAVLAKDGIAYSFEDVPSGEFYIVGNAIDNPDYLEYV